MVFFFLFLAVLIAFIGRKKGKAALIMSFLILFIFAGLRYMYGNDYSSYYNWFLRMKAGWASPFEQELLYNLLSSICPTFQVLVIVTSGVFLWVIYKLIAENSHKEYAWISVLIFVINPYLFLMNLSAIRQCMAMILFIIAIPYAVEKKFVQYVIIVLLGALFHKSALVLLPIAFLLRPEQFRRKHVFIVLGIMILFMCIVDLRRISTAVAMWFEDKNYLAHAESDAANSIRATLLTSVYFFYVLLNMEKLQGKELVYAKLSLVGYMLGICAFRMSMFTRVQMFFDIFTVITLPAIFQTVNQEGKIRINLKKPQETVWRCVNKYVMPMLILTIYVLRMYSFMTNPMWRPFTTYQTIFSA